MISRRLLSYAAVVGVVGSPLQAYNYYTQDPRLRAVVSSARAVRWHADPFPLRFRILDTGHRPDHADLNAENWREIVRRGLAAWTDIETADISIVLERPPLVAEHRDMNDGINTIGFEASEVRGYRATAFLIQEEGRTTGCDIQFDPTIFDDWPEDDPQVAEWSAHFLEEVVMHEMGHCLGLGHVPANPVWLGQSANSPNWPPGFLPETLGGLSSDPQMSVAASYGVPRLMPDDRVGVSLLYPAPGFLEGRGSIGGRVAFSDGEPAAFAYVQAVDYASGEAAFGPGAFADKQGHFRVEGLPAGPVHLWVRPARFFAFFGEGFVRAFQNSGTADIVDEHRWFSVRAGVVTTAPDITVTSGRRSP